MKPREKIMIAILILITVIVLAIFFITRNKKTGELQPTRQSSTTSKQSENMPEDNDNPVEQSSTTSKQAENTSEDNNNNVSVLSDGTRKNISQKLNETKNFDDGLEVTEIQLTEKDNMTRVLGKITNKSDIEKGGYTAYVVLMDEEGKEIFNSGVYIQPIKPGESVQLNTNGTFDGANAYDLKIIKK